jgi:membrane associated rhomboid family serine protease
LQDRQWGRLLWSAVLHADEVHLAYNMASFLYKVGSSLQ